MGREATAKNLEAAGYGVPCSRTLGEAQRAKHAQQEPCYVALGMRSEGDQRPASVYKPDQRAQLQARCNAPCACEMACPMALHTTHTMIVPVLIAKRSIHISVCRWRVMAPLKLHFVEQIGAPHNRSSPKCSILP